MELSERSLGWLRYLEGARHVDDADACAVALGLMARRTPAWTERFVAALDRLIEVRFRRGDAAPATSPATVAFITPDVAELLLLLGVRSMIDGGDDRWNRPAELVRLDLPEETPSHRALSEAVAATWADPAGPPPETPTAWRAALLGGLGLLLHDRRHGSSLHATAFVPWWSAVGGSIPPSGFAAALYLAPQDPATARRLFDERWQAQGWQRPPTLPLAADDEAAIALLLARHWDLTEHATRLRDAIEASYQARWDEERGSFAWAELASSDSTPPAARLSAWLAAADATQAHQWSALSDAPLPAQPQVVDTDFPTFALRRAEWNAGFLTLRFAPRREDRSVRTTFRIVGAEPRIWCVSGVNDITMDVTARDVVVRVPVVDGTVEFAPGSY